MCRLFGLRANRPVDIEFSMVRGDTSFQRFAFSNPHGWGIGWYDAHGRPKVSKEPLPADEKDAGFERCVEHANGTIFIAHVRLASRGNVCWENCHPFQYGGWLFAHNGTVASDSLYHRLNADHQYAIEGDTDSEVYFHWILQNIEENGGDVPEGIRTAVEVLIDNSYGNTGLNFVLSDGADLYAFRKAFGNADYYSLYYLERDPTTPGPTSLRSSETGALLSSKALKGEKAVLVCSERLTEDEDWQPVPLDHLLTVSSDLTCRTEKLF